jgi:5-methylthioadenosine/S-adenosylhomocysteine deaminase
LNVDDNRRIGGASRRAFLKLGGAAFIADVFPPIKGVASVSENPADKTTMSARTLIRGGAIISMDPQVGNFESADLLIEGKKIAKIAPHITADGAHEIDARGMILIPGFCDPHIHAWQGHLAGILANQRSQDPSHDYVEILHRRFAPIYRPQDMYVGTLITMLHCLNAGITTINDCSHNSRSSAHSDAAIQAIFDSGARGVHASGPPISGEWDHQWPTDLYRIRTKYFTSEDQLVTLRIFPRPQSGIPADSGAVLQVRRDLDLWYTFDTAAGLPFKSPVPELYASGILTGKESYNHALNFPLASRLAIAQYGARVNVAPRIDSQFFTFEGHRGIPAIQDWLDVGIRPSMSSDDPITYAIDMFSEMKLYYAFQRAMAQNARFNNHTTTPANITVRETLEAATLRGAEGCALSQKVGTLTVGKEADIVLIQSDTFHLYPMHNLIALVVEGATVGDVDTVFVAGKLVKQGGKMLGVNLTGIKKMVDESRDYLFGKAGWRPDRFAD